MAPKVILTAVGLGQETGTLLRWLKPEGEQVTKGEPLAEIMTDKATVELEAPADGVLTAVAAAEGEEIPVGQVIATVTALAAGASPSPGAAAPFPATALMDQPSARSRAPHAAAPPAPP